MLPTEVFHRHARIGLPQEPDNLRFREPLLHRPTLSLGRTLNENATEIRGDVTCGMVRVARGHLVELHAELPHKKCPPIDEIAQLHVQGLALSMSRVVIACQV